MQCERLALAHSGADDQFEEVGQRFVVIGAVLFIAGFFSGGGLLIALAAGFTGGLGIPRWMLGFLKKRREGKFLHNFPDAVDVIVRGVKAGLPLGDCLRIIATESQEPVRSEFKVIVEEQTVGIPMGDACAKLFERMPLPEANFFGIVISIQQRAGGNLSEALGNLSRVLRDRRKMKGKIGAISMEAKASAAIIGALPIVVMMHGGNPRLGAKMREPGAAEVLVKPFELQDLVETVECLTGVPHARTQPQMAAAMR